MKQLALLVALATALTWIANMATAQPPGPGLAWMRVDTTTHIQPISAMLMTVDSGYVFGGNIGDSTTDDADVHLWKTDRRGNLEWDRRYGGEQDDMLDGMSLTSDGGLIAVGRTDSWGHVGRASYVVRLNAQGDTLWTRVIGEYALETHGVCETPSGQLLLAGTQCGGTSSGLCEGFLLGFSAGGDSLWRRNYAYRPTRTQTKLGSIVPSGDGGYLLSGGVTIFNSAHDTTFAALLKVSESGELQWWQTYSLGEQTVLGPANVAADGTIYLTGALPDSLHSGRSMALIVRLDRDGNLLWHRTHQDEGQHSESASVLVVHPAGGCVTAGVRLCQMGNDRVVLLRYRADGELLWESAYLSPTVAGLECLSSNVGGLLPTAGDGYAIAGDVIAIDCDSCALHSNMFLMQTAADPLAARASMPGASLSTFELAPAYPNPFNNSSRIRFVVRRRDRVTLNIVDVTGRKVKSLLNTVLSPGSYEYDFDARGQASGIYFCTLTAGSHRQAIKMILLR